VNIPNGLAQCKCAWLVFESYWFRT